ncbi:MAG: hypothetical protein V3T05_00035, partial [Myxococcota bacterium]
MDIYDFSQDSVVKVFDFGPATSWETFPIPTSIDGRGFTVAVAVPDKKAPGITTSEQFVGITILNTFDKIPVTQCAPTSTSCQFAVCSDVADQRCVASLDDTGSQLFFVKVGPQSSLA